MINKAILLKTDGKLSIVDIDFCKLMEDKELCSPISKQGYTISVAVKLFSTYENEKDIIINNKATHLFTKGDIYGDVYILLDPEKTQEKSLEKVNQLFNDLKNNTYQIYTPYDRYIDGIKIKTFLEEFKKNMNK
jgi:hypothetical protein